VVDLNY